MMRQLLILALFCFALPRAVLAQEGIRSGTLALEIQMRRSTYRIGDSIDVRLTIRNLSDRVLVSYPGWASYRTTLQVIDSAGGAVAPTLLGPLMVGGVAPLNSLPPGGEEVLMSHRGDAWVNLRDWGYDLSRPGKYSIVGSPTTTRDFATSSNRVDIEIID
jgi:hypothetical protein